MKLDQIRKSFLNYFSKKNHVVLKSSPLVPQNDNTLLFTNAGMVQFKNKFIGKESIEYPRVVTSQKCLRAGGKHNDLENVGYTARHHTFFEMLGNFSFGDYFKEEAIFYAWDYLTNILNLNKDNLYITIYHNDDEAFSLWRKISGFTENRIIKIKTDDNFWSLGDVGPCGPCSEVFYDHGDQYKGSLPGVGDEGDRYVEIWNLVFMEFEKLEDQSLIQLPQKSIDTGMGLERITAVMQGVNNNFEIDLFKELINSSMKLSKNYHDVFSHRVIADHIRSVCFLISDGILPSNEGRGYVLRRIMRRAIRHLYLLKSPENILGELAKVFISLMGDIFTELKLAKKLIINTVKNEEEKFFDTFSLGMKYLKEENLSNGQTLSGQKAFRLYDTYGFPLDLTKDILKSRGVFVDEKGFSDEMEKQRAKASKNDFKYDTNQDVWLNIHKEYGDTKFIRNEESVIAKIIAIVKDGRLVNNAFPDEEVIIFTDKTTFYAESGGQIGDSGMIDSKSVVYDTKLFVSKLHGHFTLLKQKVNIGMDVKLCINFEKRRKTQINHSATHLLHYALRVVLGEHVFQKGSFVNDEKLRFDFSHTEKLTYTEIYNIESIVNGIISENFSVQKEFMNIDDAKSKGALALFGEKYDEYVRIVKIGKSIELCGGSHVNNSGEIGYFVIKSDDAIASGIRRIEAYSGKNAVYFARTRLNILDNISNMLNANTNELVEHIDSMNSKLKNLEKSNQSYKIKHLHNSLNKKLILDKVFYFACYEESKLNFRLFLNKFKEVNKNFTLFLGNINNGDLQLFFAVSGEYKKFYNANSIMKKCLDKIVGNGGGNAEIAQGKSSDSKIYRKALNIIEDMLVNI